MSSAKNKYLHVRIHTADINLALYIAIHDSNISNDCVSDNGGSNCLFVCIDGIPFSRTRQKYDCGNSPFRLVFAITVSFGRGWFRLISRKYTQYIETSVCCPMFRYNILPFLPTDRAEPSYWHIIAPTIIDHVYCLVTQITITND